MHTTFSPPTLSHNSLPPNSPVHTQSAHHTFSYIQTCEYAHHISFPPFFFLFLTLLTHFAHPLPSAPTALPYPTLQNIGTIYIPQLPTPILCSNDSFHFSPLSPHITSNTTNICFLPKTESYTLSPTNRIKNKTSA